MAGAPQLPRSVGQRGTTRLQLLEPWPSLICSRLSSLQHTSNPKPRISNPHPKPQPLNPLVRCYHFSCGPHDCRKRWRRRSRASRSTTLTLPGKPSTLNLQPQTPNTKRRILRSPDRGSSFLQTRQWGPGHAAVSSTRATSARGSAAANEHAADVAEDTAAGHQQCDVNYREIRRATLWSYGFHRRI